jgi:hypothetical protein
MMLIISVGRLARLRRTPTACAPMHLTPTAADRKTSGSVAAPHANFRGDVVAPIPLPLERSAFVGEPFGEPLHHFGDE